jgi:hypothetical protein
MNRHSVPSGRDDQLLLASADTWLPRTVEMIGLERTGKDGTEAEIVKAVRTDLKGCLRNEWLVPRGDSNTRHAV